VAHPPAAWSVESAGRAPPALVEPVPHSTLDLSDEAAVRAFLRGSRTDAWVNFAARTDVEACESERPAEAPAPDTKGRSGSAWRLNAELPRWLAEEAEAQGKFLVHLSCDQVFDGSAGPYPEATPPSPLSPAVSWCGYTKGVGEAAVYRSKGRRAIVRIADPYGSQAGGRTDLALTLLSQRHERHLPPLDPERRITPTWIPDVSDAIGAILTRSSGKLYHVASPEVTSPYGFARALLEAGGWSAEEIVPSSHAPLASTIGAPNAPRPAHGGLLVREIHLLDLRPITYREGTRRLVDVFGADEGSRARARAALAP
jgi:dTDP-4-dehydrorhamnose reductase